MKKKDPIKEAYRYLDNADKLLKENTTVDNLGHYSDPKYVKMAGHTAYTAMLVALEPLLPSLKKDARRNMKMYQNILLKKARNYAKVFDSAYQEAHLNMSYDGDTNTRLKKSAWHQIKTIIEWADNYYKQHKTPILTGYPQKKCKTCGNAFTPKRHNHVYCKPKCRQS